MLKRIYEYLFGKSYLSIIAPLNKIGVELEKFTTHQHSKAMKADDRAKVAVYEAEAHRTNIEQASKTLANVTKLLA